MNFLVLFQIPTLALLCIYQADCLTCPDCDYISVPGKPDIPGIDGFIETFGNNVTCREGSSGIDSDTCDSPPAAGKKAVCINSGGKMTMKLKPKAVGTSLDFKYTIYARMCYEISKADHPNSTGTLDISEMQPNIDSLVDSLSEYVGSVMTVTEKSATGGATYCTADHCGATVDITDLASGVRGVLPSLVLTAVLAVLTIAI